MGSIKKGKIPAAKNNITPPMVYCIFLSMIPFAIRRIARNPNIAGSMCE